MVGTMTTDSQLVDWLVVGEPLWFAAYHVIDWKYTDGDQVIRVRDDRGD
jgi:hypothetical protein